MADKEEKWEDNVSGKFYVDKDAFFVPCARMPLLQISVCLMTKTTISALNNLKMTSSPSATRHGELSVDHWGRWRR